MTVGVANMPQDSMHVRIKRKDTTVFLMCYPEQEVAEVKRKIGQMFQKDDEKFRLVYKDMVLDDTATIRAQQISPNDVIHLVYKADRSDDFEKIEFDDLDKKHAEYEAKNREPAAS
eukprot:TRINITY_DN84292_c0_g1_i1.p2 TRINITY_DN84292_c0_g1~~TRINITY_DN84292_c0_g1_i1.p2  ORF type:complete len:116 (+),score=31.83 TRINITY_DN84292_c0_g1_i1:102-449(+)